ncbi:hypothetical protein [Rhizobium grahamii]|uniref:hypothetical protein n=1 Tax=Rhizobium grahamii TaxID=1120045 RepID=UPI00114764CE|nr:hypothetical protein [Rhizobium grahamii]
MMPFDVTGATLTTDGLAALQTGYPAGPDAEKRAEPAFFAFIPHAFVIAVILLLGMLIPRKAAVLNVSHHLRRPSHLHHDPDWLADGEAAADESGDW